MNETNRPSSADAMKEMFFVNWAPEDAEAVASLIAKKAGEAKELGEGAEVMLRFMKDTHGGKSSTHAAVLLPGTRLVVMGDLGEEEETGDGQGAAAEKA